MNFAVLNSVCQPVINNNNNNKNNNNNNNNSTCQTFEETYKLIDGASIASK